MSELREQMIRNMQLAGYYMTAPDQLTERQVEDYILYVRDELGIAQGTFSAVFAGINYLSRYVLRIAIINARILAMDETHVTFRWKDRRADIWRTIVYAISCK